MSSKFTFKNILLFALLQGPPLALLFFAVMTFK